MSEQEHKQNTVENISDYHEEQLKLNLCDSDVLLNRYELDRMLQKARLEGAVGYITYLCQVLDDKKIKTLNELTQTIRGDWDSASGALSLLLTENLLLDGYANGLMDNINPEKQTNKQ